MSGDADFEAHPFASGAFRQVAQGRYTKGRRRGRLCVVKWFKQQYAAHEDEYFAADLAVVRKAQEAVDAWNAQGFLTDTIYLNHPEIWRPGRGPHAGKQVLVEPWIPTYERYNSNTGLAASGSGYWHEVMQALSHFSYHHSGGRLVLCDLQGGIQCQGGRPKQAVLTDPAILSLDKRYGATDLGKEGVATFFHHHECSRCVCLGKAWKLLGVHRFVGNFAAVPPRHRARARSRWPPPGRWPLRGRAGSGCHAAARSASRGAPRSAGAADGADLGCNVITVRPRAPRPPGYTCLSPYSS
jgi:hypothetical protein